MEVFRNLIKVTMISHHFTHVYVMNGIINIHFDLINVHLNIQLMRARNTDKDFMQKGVD